MEGVQNQVVLLFLLGWVAIIFFFVRLIETLNAGAANSVPDEGEDSAITDAEALIRFQVLVDILHFKILAI